MDNKFEYDTEENLLIHASTAINVPFKDIDKTGRLENNKGGVGTMIEESHFGYSPNSKSEADFNKLSIELKVTPFITKFNKKDNSLEYKAKERLVLNIINYKKENLESIYASTFWRKNKKILMMFYEYNKQLSKEEWFIDDLILFSWPKKDFPIIMNDWITIANKIKCGKAHELSESDTMYLSACTKGSTAEKSMREQPFSNIKAKQRAYSLKPSYMTSILNDYVYGSLEDVAISKSNNYRLKVTNESEQLVTITDLDKPFSIFEYIKDKITPYVGKTQCALVTELDVKQSKATNASIVNNIFKLNGDIRKTDEFIKANIVPKTIRIEANGSIKEDMSFAAFKFNDIANQEWEDSDFYSTLTTTTFMFIIFQKTDDLDSNAIFKGIKFWSMPDDDIDIAKNYWDKFKSILQQGVELIEINGTVKNNLPKKRENPIIHVRPHSSKSAYRTPNFNKGDLKDADALPDGRYMTKHCFWLNKQYIKHITSDNT